MNNYSRVGLNWNYLLYNFKLLQKCVLVPHLSNGLHLPAPHVIIITNSDEGSVMFSAERFVTNVEPVISK